jgi:hypothetical protein
MGTIATVGGAIIGGLAAREGEKMWDKRKDKSREEEEREERRERRRRERY